MISFCAKKTLLLKQFLFPRCLVGSGYCTIPLQIKYGLFYHCNLKAARKEWTSLSRQSVPLPRSSRARKAWKSLLRAPLAAPLTRDLGDPVSRSWSEWMAPAMVVVVGKTRDDLWFKSKPVSEGTKPEHAVNKNFRTGTQRSSIWTILTFGLLSHNTYLCKI